MGARCGRCSNALFKYMERPGDTATDRHIRGMLFPVSCTWPGVCAFMTFTPDFFMVGCSLLLLATFGSNMALLLKLNVSLSRLATVTILFQTMGLLVLDVHASATFTNRAWPMIIVMMDLLLVIEADQRQQAATLAATVLVTSVVALEFGAKTGLHNLARWNDDGGYKSICECDDPPCKGDFLYSFGHGVVPIIILLADYHITRSFAVRLRSQLNLIDATVAVAEKVAQLSAEYDIAQARGVVEDEGGALSEPLLAAFTKLLTNLERYRAFLPAGLLADATSGGGTHAGDPERTQLLPQLDSEHTRNALHSIFSEAAVRHRAQVDALMAERFEACLHAEDATSARHLLETGWEAPPELMECLEGALSTIDFFPVPSWDVDVAGGAVAAQTPRRPPSNYGATRTSFVTGGIITVTPAPRASEAFLPRGVSGMVTNSVLSEAGPGAGILSPALAPGPGRYGDGADQPASTITLTELWPPGYAPPSANDAVHRLAQWHSPTGDTFWPSDLVTQLIADFDLYYWEVAGPRRQNIAIYVYTTEINHPVIWVAWHDQECCWRLYPDLDEPGTRAAQAEAGLSSATGLSPAPTSRATSLLLDIADMREAGMDTRGSACRVELMLDSEWGMRVYGTGGVPRLLRYENRKRGDPEASPMHDTVVWAPCPSTIVSPDSIFSYTRPGHLPPPPGVLEFTTSRDFRTTHAQCDWCSTPVTPECLEKLYGTCMAQKNQQRAKEKLCQLAWKIFSRPPDELANFSEDAVGLGPALPVLYLTKCPDDCPTPGQIAHACELGVLRWRGSNILVALTGEPRVAVPLGSHDTPRAETLSRLNREYETGQPYYLMNSAMRSQQNRDFNALLKVRGKSFTLVARQPRDPPAPPAPALFVCPEGGFNRDTTAQWAGQGWAVSVSDMPVAIEPQGEVIMYAWGLPQYRALIWHIDMNLNEMPTSRSSDERMKGYRGLNNVSLDRDVYRRGNIVVFTAFTSTSADQGVASGFAMGPGAAAVFTMFTCTGRSISNWSRFGREKEVLLRPNTLHLVTEALSAEHAAIMDKETLQVFDLREVTTAGAVRHMAKEGALSVSRDYPSVLRQAELASVAAEKGDWLGALRELLTAPADSSGAGEGRFVRSILPRDAVGVIALVCSSPQGPELGAGIDTGLWNDFFELVGKCATAHGANVMATPLGHIIVQVARDGAEATASAAVSVAEELVEAAAPTAALASPMRSARPTTPPGDTSSRSSVSSVNRFSLSSSLKSLGSDCFSPAATLRRRCRRRSGHVRAENTLQVHCGVTVGTVHSGFGGSSQHRVEIADGPAVRRAFCMAAYSRRFGVKEIVTDLTCSASAAREGCVVWTVDFVSFGSERDMREQLRCVEPRKCQESMDHIPRPAASLVEEAWAAVAAVAAGPSNAAKMQRLRDCVAALPHSVANHRVARALADAAEKPATYCCDLDALA
eukprot:TRINITY_DN1444_c2_g4_i1.p1 TRINITY_DN1444_c2_g4~~TRINITY_DN1444_c2_g4_i1.p1  ORF type:complete len:1471 (+),score=353.61 TRINITY_DN1444_c2_g4_i1:84-4415(+)